MQRGLEEVYLRGGQPIRRFTDARIQDAISGALAAVPTNSAVLHFEKLPEGWNAAFAARLNGHWSIAWAYTRDDWGDALGAQVKFEW